MEQIKIIVCPPPCSNGERCKEEVLCTPGNCPYKQKTWRHTAECVRHFCAHDFMGGPSIEMEGGYTASCACGMTAFSHDMTHAP